MSPLLDIHQLAVGYGDLPVVSGLDLRVERGEIVALLGANGAGKTTTILAIAGALPSQGSITFDGRPLSGPVHRRARNGIGLIPEGRAVFMGLSTEKNLRLGSGPIEGALDLFPELRPLLHRKAGLLSGGEQQILGLARVLAANPKLLLVDELSLGLAPKIVQRLLESLHTAAQNGAGVLLVEQHARQALGIADRGYVMARGRCALTGTGDELLERLPDIERTYLHGPDDADGARSGPQPDGRRDTR
jgi:branched-chain amino acid transport system ATP-binding protein